MKSSYQVRKVVIRMKSSYISNNLITSLTKVVVPRSMWKLHQNYLQILLSIRKRRRDAAILQGGYSLRPYKGKGLNTPTP